MTTTESSTAAEDVLGPPPLAPIGRPALITAATLDAVLPDGALLRSNAADRGGIAVTVSVRADGHLFLGIAAARGPARPRVPLARELPPVSGVTVTTDGATVRVAGPGVGALVELEPFRLSVLDGDGTVILRQAIDLTDVADRVRTPPAAVTPLTGGGRSWSVTFDARPDEHFYGFGEKFTAFDKRGQHLTEWNHDALGALSERAYKNVPFFISTAGYGMFVDGGSAIRFDMVASNTAAWSCTVPDTAFEAHVLVGTPAQILARYAALVGPPILPPPWAFGVWASSGFLADSSAAVTARVRELNEDAIPVDVIHLDCYWQRFGRWSDMQWDTDTFPEPRELLKELADDDLRVSLWINSYIGIESPLFTHAAERGYLLRTPSGAPYVIDLWSGNHPPVGLIDFTNPAATTWFKELTGRVLEDGADVLKTDFGEAIPRDVVASNGMTGEDLHNVYALLYNDAAAEATRTRAGHSLVWGRSTWSGGQRHAAQWNGDPNATWADLASTLRGGLSLAMCGHPFWSHDIGGFNGTPDLELFVRWAQFGLLSPLSRLHGRTSRMPRDFGPEAVRLFRRFARLRMALHPYLLAEARHSAASGEPLLRPLVLDDHDDPATWSVDLQYRLGRDLLVAPFYAPGGRRQVYFPAGRWADLFSGEVVTGPGYRPVEKPLAEAPVYARVGAILPVVAPAERVARIDHTTRRALAFVPPGGAAAARPGPDAGAEGPQMVEVREHGGTVTVRTGGAEVTRLQLPLLGGRQVTGLVVDGRAVALPPDGLASGALAVGAGEAATAVDAIEF